jgi:hypothetical protein
MPFSQFEIPAACVRMSARVLKNKYQAVSRGARRFGKRSIFEDM